MKDEFLYFVDFGLENISILVAQMEDHRLVKIPLIATKKINPPLQRPTSTIHQMENFDTLLTLIDEVEHKLKTNIYSIILISKNITISSFFTQCKITFKKKQKILQIHKEKLATTAIKSFLNETTNANHILDVICNYFNLDEEKYIKNPYKMICKSILLNATIIGIKHAFIANFSAFLERFKLHVTHYISPCVAVWSLIQNSLSKNDNFLIIDIGSSSAEFCIIQDRNLTYLDVVNIGGLDVTRDIAHELKIYLYDADIAKKNITNDKVKADANATANFAIMQVKKIADARLYEIFESIANSIKQNKTINEIKFKTIYLFGGVADHESIKDIVKEVFDANVEILDETCILDNETICTKITEEYFKKKNLQLFGAVNFYVNNLNLYCNAKRGFLFKIPAKISCFLKDLLY